MNLPDKPKIAVIGLGYVGLPLAAAFAQAYSVIGFDIDTRRIRELEASIDVADELRSEELEGAAVHGIPCTNDLVVLHDLNVFVAALPTHIEEHCRPRGLIRPSGCTTGSVRPGRVTR